MAFMRPAVMRQHGGLSDGRVDMDVQRDVLVLPGWQNSGPAHWQSLWQEQQPGWRRVEQRDWQQPRLEDWCLALDRAVFTCRKPPLLLAHSLGCLLVAHWAGRGGRAHAAMLVAPPDLTQQDTPAELFDFRPVPLRPLPFPTLLIASRDDPYASFARAAALARAWGSELHDAGLAGHLNTDAGYGPWPQGLMLWRDWLEGLPLPA